MNHTLKDSDILRVPGRREPEIAGQLDRQNSNVEHLHGAISDLLERLEPALRPLEPSASLSGSASKEMSTAIGQRLDAHNDRIDGAVDRIRDAINRLEI